MDDPIPIGALVTLMDMPGHSVGINFVGCEDCGGPVVEVSCECGSTIARTHFLFLMSALESWRDEVIGQLNNHHAYFASLN